MVVPMPYYAQPCVASIAPTYQQTTPPIYWQSFSPGYQQNPVTPVYQQAPATYVYQQPRP